MRWNDVVGPAACALVGIAALTGCGSSGSADDTATAAPPDARPAHHQSVAALVGQVRSGVVRIETDDCTGSATGTGFLVGRHLVATVEHVVDGAQSIDLKQHGETVAGATVIGQDSARDVALLRTSLPVRGHIFHLADRPARLGESVAALGFPLGLPLSLTKGSVSGTNRKVPIDEVVRRQLVQTDTAVNPGNSGGPLFSTGSGEVIGLVDLKDTEGSGIGFAVSTAVASPLLEAWRAAPQAEPVSGCDEPDDQPDITDDAPPPPPDDGPDTSGPQTYDGSDFAIDYPAAWSVKAAEASKSFGTDTTIIDPGDPDRLLRVDVSPQAGDPDPMVGVQPLVEGYRGAAGYRQIDLSRDRFAGNDAVHWEFEVLSDGRLLHKEDELFVSDDGRGFAVLTQAPAESYDATAFDGMRTSLFVY